MRKLNKQIEQAILDALFLLKLEIFYRFRGTILRFVSRAKTLGLGENGFFSLSFWFQLNICFILVQFFSFSLISPVIFVILFTLSFCSCPLFSGSRDTELKYLHFFYTYYIIFSDMLWTLVLIQFNWIQCKQSYNKRKM